MSDEIDGIADRLRAWTAELDHCDPIQIRAVLAAAAMQLAQRAGPRGAAAEIQELAAGIFREPMH